MKWVPNKMLHFEVAIIKAIQTLGQATLDEVIEKLSQLRDGKSVPADADRRGENSSAEKAAVSDSKNVSRAGGGLEASAPRVAETSLDANELWQKSLAKIPAQKAFVRNSAAVAHVLGIEGRNFQLGFAPGDKAMMDILGTQANRKFLETILYEITGTDWSVKLAVKEELPSKQASASEGSRPEDFKEDPLIQQAIGLFNAQIVKES